ncbi:MAG: hypothetical protein IPJ21_18860 [Sterolibacteriaceae bacterium]|nr:hypothetical protein [Sterolibacteriaceae bacterium]MBK9085801.1 hypothetical protein [Sterolibacteriaceae bacterium]
MKFTQYFLATRARPDRAQIREEWIARAIRSPIRQHIQADGRILRVVLLDDGETVHNAFFDRGFQP